MKDIVYQEFADVAASFASPKRLEIIELLMQGEKDVETLSTQISSEFANTSRHLQILKKARLVEHRRDGVHIFYRISDDKIFNCWKSLQVLAESRAAEMKDVLKKFLEDRNSLKAIKKEELWSRIQTNDVVIIDVRPNEEYISGHIKGSVSIPLSELKNRLDEIPANREIVAYCRGPYCVLAPEAVEFLKSKGYNAVRLEEGVMEWKSAGFPVEQLNSINY